MVEAFPRRSQVLMLSTLLLSPALERLYSAFLERLGQTGFSRTIDCSYSARLSVATDNSAFQWLPQGVLFPCNEDDIAQIFVVLAEDDFHAVHVSLMAAVSAQLDVHWLRVWSWIVRVT